MRRSFPAIVLAAAAVFGIAAPAAAHSDTGRMTVVAAEQVDAATIRIEIGLAYDNDGDLAPEASVQAELTGPAGEKVGPVELAVVSGARYGADVEVPAPGTWSVRVNSTGPAAEATVLVLVAGETPTTTTTEAAEVPLAEDDEANGTGRLVALVLGAAVLTGGAYVLVRRHRG
jgi:hypothetical protein